MKPGLRKLALTAHIASSVGWLGAAFTYLGVVGAALITDDPGVVRGAYLVIEPMTWFAIVPLAVGSLLTGLVQGLGTGWGLFRHYWVVFKLVLSVLATAVLVANTRTVARLGGVAAETDALGTGGLHGQLVHSAGGVLVLLVTTALAVYKPRGLTPYGRRKQAAARVRLGGSPPTAE